MKYAIIAAGEGSRLTQEGVGVAKPLVEVAGQRLIDRLLNIFMDNGASEIVVVCREDATVVQHLTDIQKLGLNGRQIPLRFIARTTPSSMHSLWELRELIGNAPFCLTTVDTVFCESEFARFMADYRHLLATDEADGLMGVTDYIDDEKPLYVRVEREQPNITAFLDSDPQPRYISAGIYALKPEALTVLQHCMERGESRMRNFQRALLAEGLRLRAWTFSKVLDIDHASDVAKAEEFLR